MQSDNRISDTDFFKMCQILQESEAWDSETLERCPRLFMLMREVWIQSKIGVTIVPELAVSMNQKV